MKQLYHFSILLVLLLLIVPSKAQSPFYCSENAYLFQFNDVYAINLASGSAYIDKENVIPEGTINAAGYNPVDGYIWGSVKGYQGNSNIIRVGSDYEYDLFEFAELGTGGRYIGDVREDGVYYLKGSAATVFMIDLNPETQSTPEYLGSFELSPNIKIFDWAFNANDGMLYAVSKGDNLLYRIDVDSKKSTVVGEVPILSGLNETFGAVYFDRDGNFYVSSNSTGIIYIINSVDKLSVGGTIKSNFFAYGPSSSSNDGARCPTAPVPQEDCGNGLDDDGDGLIDCDDPSCSGEGDCPVATPTSSGTTGGLESNDRLSQKISTREFNKIRNNIIFDVNDAPIVGPFENYGQKSQTAEPRLHNLIPVGVINEYSRRETSPEDLLFLTNATEVYGLDYFNEDDERIAALLSLRTDETVYEHTKFICDRLLGSQIMGIGTFYVEIPIAAGTPGTIETEEESVIVPIVRAHIKNPDGTVEYASSYVANYNDEDGTFTIESHWTLDGYSNGGEYYNVQIWANSLNSLYAMLQESLTLAIGQAEVKEFIVSGAPSVYVRKGTYENGVLNLEVINGNNSSSLMLDGGINRSETSEAENVEYTYSINDYITTQEVETGSMFSFGFRIQGDKGGVPDDIFVSDGPWNYDVSAPGTVLKEFEVEASPDPFTEEGLSIERNVHISATIDDYVALHRAYNARYNPEDKTMYNSLKFSASGVGTMNIYLHKSSIHSWAEQYIYRIELTEDEMDYNIPYSDFKSTLDEPLVLDDGTVIVFSLKNLTGELAQDVELNISDIVMFYDKNISVEDQQDLQKLRVYPNRTDALFNVEFMAYQSQKYTVSVVNMSGMVVKTHQGNSLTGMNHVNVNVSDLPAGAYICTVDVDGRVLHEKLTVF